MTGPVVELVVTPVRRMESSGKAGALWMVKAFGSRVTGSTVSEKYRVMNPRPRLKS